MILIFFLFLTLRLSLPCLLKSTLLCRIRLIYAIPRPRKALARHTLPNKGINLLQPSPELCIEAPWARHMALGPLFQARDAHLLFCNWAVQSIGWRRARGTLLKHASARSHWCPQLVQTPFGTSTHAALDHSGSDEAGPRQGFASTSNYRRLCVWSTPGNIMSSTALTRAVKPLSAKLTVPCQGIG